MRLENKTAIITGAAGGIGFKAAGLFIDQGATVILVDLDEGKLRQAVADIGSERASYQVADVTDADQMQSVVSTVVRQQGRLDIFVANAGIEGVIKAFVDYPVDVFDRVMNVNVRGVFLGVRAALAVMQGQGSGSIIITASGAAVRGAAGMAAYVASKHAAVGLMKVAALDAARFSVRVNAVTPGPVETSMMRALEEAMAPGHAEEAHQAGAARIPMGRYAEPEDVAQTMLFLASDDSRYCTGGLYAVDGGISAR